jgi:ATP-dependent RNA helicase DDX23/PRP28
MRARHLGQKIDQKKPRLRKEGNKKFVFDWKADEDTSGHNPNMVLDAKGLGPGGVMLGGNLAGYDGASKDGIPDKCVFFFLSIDQADVQAC